MPMLKLLYKKLLISVISSSLITMNMTVMAEDTAPKNNVNAAIAPMSKSTDSGLTRDANGVLSKTENYKFEGSQAEDGPLSIIVMLAIGVIGTKLMMYKKWTLDMTVVAVASAAYIAAEILNLLNLGNELKAMTVQITKRSDGTIDKQKSAGCSLIENKET